MRNDINNINVITFNVAQVDADNDLVLLRDTESAATFVYCHNVNNDLHADSAALYFVDSNISDDAPLDEVNDLNDLHDATDFFAVSSRKNLHASIASAIFAHYNHVGQHSELNGFCEITALRDLTQLQVAI